MSCILSGIPKWPSFYMEFQFPFQMKVHLPLFLRDRNIKAQAQSGHLHHHSLHPNPHHHNIHPPYHHHLQHHPHHHLHPLDLSKNGVLNSSPLHLMTTVQPPYHPNKSGVPEGWNLEHTIKGAEDLAKWSMLPKLLEKDGRRIKEINASGFGLLESVCEALSCDFDIHIEAQGNVERCL